MAYYLATLVFHIELKPNSGMDQFDEQFRLIIAQDETGALIKAEEMGLAEEETFENENSQIVNWLFLGTTRLIHLSRLVDGDLVFSNHREIEKSNGFGLLQKNLAENLLKRTILRELASLSPNKQ